MRPLFQKSSLRSMPSIRRKRNIGLRLCPSPRRRSLFLLISWIDRLGRRRKYFDLWLRRMPFMRRMIRLQRRLWFLLLALSFQFTRGTIIYSVAGQRLMRLMASSCTFLTDPLGPFFELVKIKFIWRHHIWLLRSVNFGKIAHAKLFPAQILQNLLLWISRSRRCRSRKRVIRDWHSFIRN